MFSIGLLILPIIGHADDRVQIGWGDRKPQPLSPEQIEKQKKINDAVEDKVKNIGSHREKEARSFVEMQEAAHKARNPTALNNKQVQPVPPKPPAQPEKKEECKFNNDVMQPKNFEYRALGQKSQVEDYIRSSTRLTCLNAGNAIVSNMNCTSYRAYVGKPIAIDGKLIYKKEDYRDGWQCKASYKCSQPKKVCHQDSTAPAKVTRQ